MVGLARKYGTDTLLGIMDAVLDYSEAMMRRALQALAQTGLTYAEGPYDRERYEAVQRIAAEMAAAAGGEDPEELLARFAEESGFRTPKVDVRGVVLDAGRVLLVREPGSHGWCLPGGWADVGETPSRAVEKEVVEEAGLTVRAARLLGVTDVLALSPGVAA